jgi:quercetin dioxygenase-like cupin family protein
VVKFRKLREEPGEMEREEGSQGVNSIDIVLKRTDLKAFSSRLLRIAPGGHTNFHAHSREHVVVVVSGMCRVETEEGNTEVRGAMVMHIAPWEKHRFFNTGGDGLALLIMNLFTEDEQKPEEGQKPEGP